MLFRDVWGLKIAAEVVFWARNVVFWRFQRNLKPVMVFAGLNPLKHNTISCTEVFTTYGLAEVSESCLAVVNVGLSKVKLSAHPVKS
jgi:hypothetical protein